MYNILSTKINQAYLWRVKFMGTNESKKFGFEGVIVCLIFLE